jgi:hypothetical protein
MGSTRMCPGINPSFLFEGKKKKDESRQGQTRKKKKQAVTVLCFCTAYNKDSLLMYCHVWETVQIQSKRQYNKMRKRL